MKRILSIIMFLFLLTATTFANSEAGAVWLLINPGARACGMGESGVAIADDANATYYNPAGLGFLGGREISAMHVNWLPNLASDLYYDFIAYRQHVKNVGTFGGNVAIMNLGEQTRTDESGNNLGTFNSYMLSLSLSYGTRLSRTTSFGGNFKLIHQHLTDQGAGAEKGSGQSTNFAFDVGYMKKEFLLRNLTLGVALSNVGNKIAFIDVAQADPMPTNLRTGLRYEIKGDYNSFNITWDVNKLLVASYPDRDIDGDELVGGYDENGHKIPGGDFNKDGKMEVAHSDEWYKGIFTSWVDDWFLLYDSAADGIGKEDGDTGKNKNGGKSDEDGKTNDGSLSNELRSLVHNVGFEYWYNNQFAIRLGCIYDKEGEILLNKKWPVPTFGAGLRFAGLGFDFGYTAGQSGHPRANTMFFSLNMKF